MSPAIIEILYSHRSPVRANLTSDAFRFSLRDGCGDSGDYLHHAGLGIEHCRGASGFVGPWLRCLLCNWSLFLRSLGELL